MATWVAQSDVPSISRATRRRTAYLLSLRPVVETAILESLGANPLGEEVTLDVLARLTPAELEVAFTGVPLNRLKQDLGLLVAQTLVDLVGARNVETLRREDGRSVSSRRNTRPGLVWVGNYAPHRVVPRTVRSPRILLDTSVVRNIIHGAPFNVDLPALIGLKGGHPVSIADGALPELAMALLRGAVRPEDWRARIHVLDDLLDPDFPVAPGGKELAAFWGGHPSVGVNIDEARDFYRAAWRFLRRVQTRSDLDEEMVFVAASGRRLGMSLNEAHVAATLAVEGDRWAMWVQTVSALIRKLRGDGEEITREDLRSLTMSHLVGEMGVADAERLDLVVRVLAQRAFEAARVKGPAYAPKGGSNDPLDLDLLFGIPLPGWVCTVDLRLKRLVEATASVDADKVMTPDEVVARLTLEAAPPSGKG